VAAAVVSVVLAARIYRPVLEETTVLVLHIFVAVVGFTALLLARRNDTRQIALFLAVTSLLPIFLYFWSGSS
jgi:hypothetical protein